MKRSSETGAIGSLLGCGGGRREPTHLGVAEALHEMIVDHPHRLHERVTDRRADEPKVAPDEPSCSTKARNARAFDTAARTFCRLRTMPGSRSSCAIFRAS